MSNDYFRFKQFTIRQDRCAMKVTTDSILLGAWTDTKNTDRILDVGTGTGLLVLMMAQRSNATIDAIEINEKAFMQARENINESPWSTRVNVMNISFQEYMKTAQGIYDLIICNPPYFEDDKKPPSEARLVARHNDFLTLKDLVNGVEKGLSNTGRFCVILPVEKSEKFLELITSGLLYCNKRLNVRPKQKSDIKRVLFELSKSKTKSIEEMLTIECAKGRIYSDEFIRLTREFYLKM